MNSDKYKTLIVQHWIPALISGVVGLTVGLSVSSFEANVSYNRFFLEKQAATADRVASAFSRYVENWRRIIQLKKHVDSEKRPPSSDEVAQLKTYVGARNTARDGLFTAFDALNLYFNEETSDVATKFRAWDQEQAIKTISGLPGISEWQSRERSILLSIRKDLVE